MLQPDYNFGSRFLTDDGLLLGFTADGTTEVLELASGRVLRTLGRADIGAAAPDGSRVVLCWTNKPAAGRQKLTPISPEDQAPGPARMWDIRTGCVILTLTGARKPIRQVDWSPDGGAIVTRSSGSEPAGAVDPGELCIWDGASGKLLHQLSDRPGRLVFSQDGRRFSIQGNAPALTCYDVATGQSVFAAPEGSSLQSGVFLGGNRLLLLNYRASEKERSRSPVIELPGGRELYALPDVPPINNVEASPDGSAMLTTGLDPRLFLLDSATGHRLSVYSHARDVSFPYFTPEGNRLAILSSQGCRFLDVETGRETLSLPSLPNIGRAVYFSPHGRFMYRFTPRKSGTRSDLEVWDLRPAAGE